ncbi:uncharacterized protein TRAVEDRAFT_43036 [Trametes versicolor FP-101664 SS1]|uniref:uncharacterized protein n=1 Tax=Trametes versicolor (strain FP-101664) TaxID=717944 RepID=UPI0004622516|nr:uncharacterized protein TRAVEDRAFT_43036 [Trametes versicolor FP-101664 SS1]EIW62696.1 hypothetical protein TRAVEDRAFT_43036 [Trametes versicolor FP-101664 SS1]
MIPVFITFPFRRPKAPAIAPPGPSVFDTLDNAPYLRHLVKEIEVLLPSDPCQSPELWNSPSPYAFLAGKLKLTPLGRCSQLSLPALTTLRFVGFYQDAATLQMIANGASLDFFGVTATWFPTVTTLELRHIIFNHCNQFAWLVASFVNLRNLECKHIHWGPFGNFDFYGRRLAIEPCTISRLRLEGLNEYEETSRLYRDRDAGPLLAAVASSLVDLTIDAAELLRPPSSIANVLEPLKSMLTLRVQWLLTGSRTESEERIKTSARALVHAGHPYLETLVLHVDTRLSSNPHEELAALGGELDDALASGSKFPVLQVVALHLEVEPCESSTPQRLEDTLQTAFPRTCYDAGLMRLCGSWQSEPCHQ